MKLFEKTHGKTRTPIYNCWLNMKKRCMDKNNPRYVDYGGRGISFCERWNTFENFYEDMGERPEGMTLDRIDNEQSYSKENCKWSSYKEQNNNRRSTKFITIDGQTKSMKDWCRYRGLNYYVVRSRIRIGWSPLKALTTPIKK